MSHTGTQLVQQPVPAQKKPLALRLTLLSMITVCGMLMTFIMASDPRVMEHLNLTPEFVSADTTQAELFGEAAPVLLLGLGPKDKRASRLSSAQETPTSRQQRLTVGHMPRDRVPVRRGGLTFGN